MQSKAKTVEEYLGEIPADRRASLEALRSLIHSIAPTVTEAMQYGMPAFLLGEPFCAFASQKQSMSLYCCVELLEKYRPRLGKLSCGKCCIRFRKYEDLPLEVITELLKEMAKVQTKSSH